MKSSLRVYECKFCKGRSFAENPRECCGQKVVEICPLPRIGSKDWGWVGEWGQWTSRKAGRIFIIAKEGHFRIGEDGRMGPRANGYTTLDEAKRIAELLARRDWRRENRGKK